MGGAAVWNEMTDIDAFHIVNNPAEHMDNRGNYDYVAGLSKGKDIYISSYLFSKTPAQFSIISDNYNGDWHAKNISVLNTLAHEIGHNVFNKYISINNLNDKWLTQNQREWTADYFSVSLGIRPYHIDPFSFFTLFDRRRNAPFTTTDSENILNSYKDYIRGK